MDTDESQVETTEAVEGLSDVVENSQESQTEEVTQTQEGGIHPAWEPIRQKLGLGFETIKEDILKIDKNFSEHVTKTNSQYKPWKAFEDQGITPETVTTAMGVFKNLQTQPEEVYEALGQFLKENGRLPQNKAEMEQALEDADEDEYASEEEKKIKELEKKLNDLQAFQQAQIEQGQQEQLRQKAEADVAREFSTFEQANPNLTEDDKKEIYKLHYLYAASGPENMKSLDDVSKEYFGLLERVRSAPRPNDKAPRLPGTGGGVPTTTTKDVSELDRNESRNLLAELLEKANSSN